MPEIDPDDSDELEELPPLDPSLDDEREGPGEDEATPLLEPLEEDVELDQEPAEADVDLGLALPEDSADRDEGHEVVLDIQSLLSFTDEEPPADDADQAGPAELDVAADLSDADEPIVGSLEEGTDEPLDELVSEELPELDADEPGGLENEASWLASDALRDEDLPRQAERQWQFERWEAAGVDVEALALTGTRLWVAGHDLLSFERDGAAGRREVGERLLELVALGEDVLGLTPVGALVRVSPGGGARRIGGFREALALGPAAAATLALGGLGRAGETFLVAGGTSAVAVSRDGGGSFASAEIGGRVAAVSGGAPTRLLSRGSEGAALLDWSERGFRRTLLDPIAEEVAAGEQLVVGSLGEVVALCSADRGLALSCDGGRSFARVPGCLHASALCLGSRAGRPRVWVAAFVESEERSLLIEVDAGTRSAEIVAELTPSDDVAQSDGDDGRIRALAWDAEHGWLWAGGPSGLYRAAPPAFCA